MNNNNNIFEQQTSFGESSKEDTAEKLDEKIIPGLDALDQGLSEYESDDDLVTNV